MHYLYKLIKTMTMYH